MCRFKLMNRTNYPCFESATNLLCTMVKTYWQETFDSVRESEKWLCHTKLPKFIQQIILKEKFHLVKHFLTNLSKAPIISNRDPIHFIRILKNKVFLYRTSKEHTFLISSKQSSHQRDLQILIILKEFIFNDPL